MKDKTKNQTTPFLMELHETTTKNYEEIKPSDMEVINGGQSFTTCTITSEGGNVLRGAVDDFDW